MCFFLLQVSFILKMMQMEYESLASQDKFCFLRQVSMYWLSFYFLRRLETTANNTIQHCVYDLLISVRRRLSRSGLMQCSFISLYTGKQSRVPVSLFVCFKIWQSCVVYETLFWGETIIRMQILVHIRFACMSL